MRSPSKAGRTRLELAWSFWIDRGGTFTDVVARDPDGAIHSLKLLSESPEQYADAAVEGVRRLLQSAPPDRRAVRDIRMGTTVATNALLTRAGAFIGSQRREELQRHRLSELEVVRTIDLAHAAALKRPYDAKAIGKKRPGTKSAFLWCGGADRGAAGWTEARCLLEAHLARRADRRRGQRLFGSRARSPIEQLMMVVFGSEHPLDFHDEQRVALAGSLHECATLMRGPLQRQLKHLPYPPEVVRRHGANGGSVVHKHPLTCVAEFPPGAYHAADGGYFES